MKKIIKFLFLILAFSSLRSFAQTANIQEGCAPLQVTFTGPVGNTDYYWDFKDGVTSVQQNPKNIFTHPGTFNVTLQESPTGPILGTVQIVVYEDPVVTVSGLSGCAPFTSTFQQTLVKNPAIKVKTYKWIFGDGDNVEGLGMTAPTHLYSELGEFKGSLEIVMEQESCTTPGHFIISSVSRPVAAFTTTPPLLSTCNDELNVAYKNTSTGIKPLTYLWTLGNGVTSTLETPPAQTFLKGQYISRLDVSYTNMPSCVSSPALAGISVGKPNPTIITKKDTVCGVDMFNNVDPVTFKTTTPGLYSWVLDAGAVSLSPSTHLDSVYVQFTTRGTHTITLTVSSYDGLCSTTVTKKVFVDLITVEGAFTPLITCSNPVVVQFEATTNTSTVTYNWAFPLGVQKTAKGTATLKRSVPDIYDINVPEVQLIPLTVTSKLTKCSVQIFVGTTIAIPNARFMPDKTKGCGPLTIAFSDSSTSLEQFPIVKWEWIFGDGAKQTVTDKAAFPTSHIYTNPGAYDARLVVTTSQGCIDTSYAVKIEVGKNLSSDINFTSDKTSVCPGENVTFTAQIAASALPLIKGYHYTTEGNRSFHCATEKNLTWSYDHVTGLQPVSLTVDYNGCYTTITKPNFITVKGAIAKIDYTSVCADPLNYKFKSKSLTATSLTWNFGDGNSSTTADIDHTYAPGNYTVTLTALNAAGGCAATTEQRKIYVRNVKAKISMDTLLCKGVVRTFSAAGSVGVDPDCHTGYTWQFPGTNLRPVTTDLESIPMIIYESGRYPLQLVVKDINGCRDTTKTSIKVFGVTAELVSDKMAVCVPDTINFKDVSVTDTLIAQREWSFGDGSPISGGTIVDHAYKVTPGGVSYYSGRLTVTDKLGCFGYKDFNINYYKPLSTIYPSKTGLCLGEEVTLGAPDFTAQGSNLSFTWDYGDNSTGTAASRTFAYAQAGTYTVKLKYTETGSGCKDSSTLLLNVQNYPMAAIYTPYIDTMKYLCAPLNVYFRDSSKSADALTYEWDFDDGRTSNKKDYSLFYPKGQYNARLIVRTSNGCTDTTYKPLITVVSPEGNFSMDRDTICKGEEIFFQIIDTVDVTSWRWAFGDGIVLNDSANALHRYRLHPVTGKTEARLLIRGFEDRCTITQEQDVWIYRVIADFERETGDTSICFNDGPYHFKNTSIDADNYVWHFGDGTPDRTELDQVHQYATHGIYDVRLSIANNTYGCKDTIVKKAVIYKNPVVNVKGDTAVCLGGTVDMQVIDPVATSTYEWSPATGLGSDLTLTSYLGIELLHTVRYQIVETDTNVCKGYDYARAIIVEPIKMRDLDTSIVIGDVAYLPVYASPQSIYTFTWNRTDSLSCLQCSSPDLFARPMKDILYTLVVTDTLNCRSDTAHFNIVIRPETFVKIPTVFTPNGDGSNDKIYVNGWGIKEMLEFKILNRWGQIIYSSTDKGEGWDGTFNGVLQNSDTYVYKVRVITWREEEILEEGHFTLLR